MFPIRCCSKMVNDLKLSVCTLLALSGIVELTHETDDLLEKFALRKEIALIK